MKVNGLENKEKNTVQVVVEVARDEFEGALDKAYRQNRGSIMVPGFRKGKAPRKIVERMYGENIFYEDAINVIAPDAFQKAVEEKELVTVGQPSVEDVDVSDEKVLTITFITAVYPEVVLGEYRGISAEKTVETVKKKDIDEELERLQKRNARIVAVERAAADGDTAVIDFEGFLNGEPFEGGKAEKHSLTLGSGSFVPGFEEQIVGMAPGEERDVNITFPQDYSEDLAGKDVVFKVRLHEVKESILPELDDEFAKDVSECDTLEEYKKSIKDRLTEERKSKAESDFKEAVMRQAVLNMQVDVPDAMVDGQLDNMMQEFFYSVSNQGIDPQQYLSMMGMDMETFRNTSRPNAENRVKTQLLLDAVAEQEKIEVSDEEIEAELAKLAEQYGMEIEELKKSIQPESIKGDLRRQKAADIVYDSAKVEKKPAKKAEEKKAEDAPEAEAETEEKKPVKRAAKKKTEPADEEKPEDGE